MQGQIQDFKEGVGVSSMDFFYARQAWVRFPCESQNILHLSQGN